MKGSNEEDPIDISSEDFDTDVVQDEFKLKFPRKLRASKMNSLPPLNSQMMSMVLQRWRPRLESATNEDIDVDRFEELLNDRNRGRQDISVGLDLDALTEMVDDKRRKNYQGKLRSTLRKLDVIGRKWNNRDYLWYSIHYNVCVYWLLIIVELMCRNYWYIVFPVSCSIKYVCTKLLLKAAIIKPCTYNGINA